MIDRLGRADVAKIWGFVRFVVVAFVAYLVFGTAGQLSALGILKLTSNNDVVGWAIYGLAILAAISMPVWVRTWMRHGRGVSSFARVCLAGFTAFFCWQWTVAGTPDWNPRPLVIGFVVCGAASIVVLRITRSAAHLKSA